MLTGDSIVIAGDVIGEQLTYWWQPDAFINDINDLTPTVSPPAEMKYKLSAESPYGCTSADSMMVKVVTGIYVPTAFTPNGDGKNDRWEVPYLDPSFGGTVNVFNRWGQLVYHVSAAMVSWDGKLNGIPQAAGTYVYMISFKTNDLFLKGTITLIR
jgi:gliding motility-associated-like protein